MESCRFKTWYMFYFHNEPLKSCNQGHEAAANFILKVTIKQMEPMHTLH